MNPTTRKMSQLQVLAGLVDVDGRLPSLREMMTALGLRSPCPVQRLLERLEGWGHVRSERVERRRTRYYVTPMGFMAAARHGSQHADVPVDDGHGNARLMEVVDTWHTDPTHPSAGFGSDSSP